MAATSTTNHPQLGKDLIRVVNALGTGVQLLSKEKCCGVPLIANGFFDKARKQAQSNVAAMRENTLPIICHLLDLRLYAT